jgi:hypothetical protein
MMGLGREERATHIAHVQQGQIALGERPQVWLDKLEKRFERDGPNAVASARIVPLGTRGAVPTFHCCYGGSDSSSGSACPCCVATISALAGTTANRFCAGLLATALSLIAPVIVATRLLGRWGADCGAVKLVLGRPPPSSVCRNRKVSVVGPLTISCHAKALPSLDATLSPSPSRRFFFCLGPPTAPHGLPTPSVQLSCVDVHACAHT